MEAPVKHPPPRVSIVIPVFNGERHLGACLDSAIQQTLGDIEILCVDDGSSDDTGRILMEYAERDKRLRTIRHDSNRGEGAARNTGMDNASGDFLFHLDADDTIPSNALNILYAHAQAYGSDMVKGGMLIALADGNTKDAGWTVPPGRVASTGIADSKFLQGIPTSHCTYLYKRDFLERYQIRYPLDLSIGLDIVMLAEALANAASVTLVTDIVYHYHQSEHSVTRGEISPAYVIDSIRAKGRICDILKQKGFAEPGNAQLQQWGFVIGDLWLQMPASLSRQDWYAIFSVFREVTSRGAFPPWQRDMPHQQRYLLCLILAGREDAAIDFMKTDPARRGFTDLNQFVDALQFILQTVPDDVASLYQLGCIELQEGRQEQATGFFSRVVELAGDELEYQLALTDGLVKLGRLERAHETLTAILNKLDQPLPVPQLRRLFTTGNQLAAQERSLLTGQLSTLEQECDNVRQNMAIKNSELESVREELAAGKKAHEVAYQQLQTSLDLVRGSLTWRMTAPLRYIVDLFNK